jgi:hypothetical protein
MRVFIPQAVDQQDSQCVDLQQGHPACQWGVEGKGLSEDTENFHPRIVSRLDFCHNCSTKRIGLVFLKLCLKNGKNFPARGRVAEWLGWGNLSTIFTKKFMNVTGHGTKPLVGCLEDTALYRNILAQNMSL